MTTKEAQKRCNLSHSNELSRSESHVILEPFVSLEDRLHGSGVKDLGFCCSPLREPSSELRVRMRLYAMKEKRRGTDAAPFAKRSDTKLDYFNWSYSFLILFNRLSRSRQNRSIPFRI